MVRYASTSRLGFLIKRLHDDLVSPSHRVRSLCRYSIRVWSSPTNHVEPELGWRGELFAHSNHSHKAISLEGLLPRARFALCCGPLVCGRTSCKAFAAVVVWNPPGGIPRTLPSSSPRACWLAALAFARSVTHYLWRQVSALVGIRAWRVLGQVLLSKFNS